MPIVAEKKGDGAERALGPDGTGGRDGRWLDKLRIPLYRLAWANDSRSQQLTRSLRSLQHARDMPDAIWFTWETQRRNRTLSHALGARLFEFDYGSHPVMRYPLSIVRTLWTILRQKPRVIFAQNPSLVLAALVTQYGRWCRRAVVIDAHNTGIVAFGGRIRWINALTRLILRTASLTIVSNRTLAEQVRRQGGEPVVLPDPVPDLPRSNPVARLHGDFNVLFICSWAVDEPFVEVIRAASAVAEGTHIYITGDSKGRELAFGSSLPPNVHLTGFLPEEEYVRLLYGVDLTVDLTSRDDCLVCGAYESVAAGTPMLLSDTPTTRDYFSRGAVYTHNDATAIAEKLDLARSRHPELKQEVAQLGAELTERWSRYAEVVRNRLSQITQLEPSRFRPVGETSEVAPES